MFQFLEFDKKNLFRVVDKYDAKGVERTYAQMLELGYEPEPVNKLTISGWVERRAIPDWFRGSLDEKKPLTAYMEKANMPMNERIQEIAWTSQASTSVKHRIGPFLEYDRKRFEEATDLICAGAAAISVNTYKAYVRLYQDWQQRLVGERPYGMPIPVEFDAKQKKLQALRNMNNGDGRERRSVLKPSDYEVLCATARRHLEQGKS